MPTYKQRSSPQTLPGQHPVGAGGSVPIAAWGHFCRFQSSRSSEMASSVTWLVFLLALILTSLRQGPENDSRKTKVRKRGGWPWQGQQQEPPGDSHQSPRSSSGECICERVKRGTVHVGECEVRADWIRPTANQRLLGRDKNAGAEIYTPHVHVVFQCPACFHFYSPQSLFFHSMREWKNRYYCPHLQMRRLCPALGVGVPPSEM